MAAMFHVMKMELKYTFLLLLIIPILSVSTENCFSNKQRRFEQRTNPFYDLKEFKSLCAGYEDEDNCRECIEEATQDISNKRKAAIEILKKCEDLLPKPYRECTPCPKAKACLRRIYRKLQRKKCGAVRDDKESDSNYQATPNFGEDGRAFEITANGDRWKCKCREKRHKKNEDGHSFYINTNGKLLSCRCKVKTPKFGRNSHPENDNETLITAATIHKQKDDLKLDTTYTLSLSTDDHDTTSTLDTTPAPNSSRDHDTTSAHNTTRVHETNETQSPHSSEGTSEKSQSRTNRSPTTLVDDEYNTKGNNANIHYDD